MIVAADDASLRWHGVGEMGAEDKQALPAFVMLNPFQHPSIDADEARFGERPRNRGWWRRIFQVGPTRMAFR